MEYGCLGIHISHRTDSDAHVRAWMCGNVWSSSTTPDLSWEHSLQYHSNSLSLLPSNRSEFSLNFSNWIGQAFVQENAEENLYSESETNEWIEAKKGMDSIIANNWSAPSHINRTTLSKSRSISFLFVMIIPKSDIAPQSRELSIR